MRTTQYLIFLAVAVGVIGCGSSSSDNTTGVGGSGGSSADGAADGMDAPAAKDVLDAGSEQKTDVVSADAQEEAVDAPAEAEQPEADAPTGSCTDGAKNGAETDIDCGGGTCPKCAYEANCLVDDDCASVLCVLGKCAAPTCTDTVKNGVETDTDCGGTVCPKCGTGASCLSANDCESALCANGKCAGAGCKDSAKNGSETDIDCGGSACPACADLKACLLSTDCKSKNCSSEVCQPASCTDQIMNGTETSQDCGGNACPKCADLETCLVGGDCESGVCKSSQCQPPECNDQVQNALETDVDCGGGVCPTCADSKSCKVAEDCTSGVCTAGKCKLALCNDGTKNGQETDIDCGGGICAKCDPQKHCLLATDCKSGVCDNGVCLAPDCHDTVKNGLETDSDCGGSECSPCADLKACLVGSDCQSLKCIANKCAIPTCDDLLKNGLESDKDCGGANCSPCEDGKACLSGTDCTQGSCFSSVCGQRFWNSESLASNLTIPGNQTWVDATSMGLAPYLQKPAIVLLRWIGTSRWAGGGNGLCALGQRFVIDGQPTGDPTWGSAVMVQEGSTRWHELFALEMAMPWTAGQHVVSVQMTNGSNYGSCTLDGDSGAGYDRSRLAIAAYDPAEAWYAESVGVTGPLGSASAWTDISGIDLTIPLPGERQVQLSLHGSQLAQGSGQAHCAYRLVIDGTPLGDPSHGQAIVVTDVDQGWWAPVLLKYGAVLAGGSHTIKAQVRNSASVGGTCTIGAADAGYSRYHLSATATDSQGVSKGIESTGDSQVLGSTSAWTAINGLQGSFTLATPGIVQFELAGTQRTMSGSGHCAYRFVIDGTPLGDANHGQGINVGEGAETWWTAAGLLWGQTLPAGAHTVSVDVRNSSTTGNCGVNADAMPYGRARLLMRGF